MALISIQDSVFLLTGGEVNMKSSPGEKKGLFINKGSASSQSYQFYYDC